MTSSPSQCLCSWKLLEYNHLATFWEVAASSLFHFMVSVWRSLVWELLSHTVTNRTCNFSYILELGSDSHWALDPKMAVDSLTPSALFLSFPMRNSSSGYMLLLSYVTTNTPQFYLFSTSGLFRWACSLFFIFPLACSFLFSCRQFDSFGACHPRNDTWWRIGDLKAWWHGSIFMKYLPLILPFL